MAEMLRSGNIGEIARERFLKFVVDGFRDTTNHDIQCRAQKLGMHGWGPLFTVVEISLHMDTYPIDSLDSALISIEKTVQSYLKKKEWNAWTYIDSRNTVIVLLCAQQMDSYMQLDSTLAKLIKHLMDEFGIVIYAGIGSIVNSPAEVKNSAKDASTCIGYKYSLANENVINIINVRKIHLNSSSENTTAFDRVIGCFMDGDLQRLPVRLNELLDYLEQSHCGLQVVKQAYLELLAKIMRCVTDAGIKLGEEETGDYLQHVINESRPQMIKDWFVKKCADLVQRMEAKRRESTSYIAETAKRYVELHFAEDELSQQSVSDFLGLSVGYFGHLFFSQTGQRFVDYLQQYRIETAKKQLTATNNKIKDISMAVGFSNVNYFNYQFKKQVNMTPREYRSRYRQ